MNILNVVRFFPKLSETFILDQLIGQLQKGYNPHICAYFDPREKLALEDRRLEEIVHSEIINSGLEKKTNYINPSVIGTLDLLIQQNSIDILHIHAGDLAPELYSKNIINIPSIISFHGVTLPKGADTRNLAWDNYKQAFDRAELILTVSEKWKDDLISLGAPTNKTRVHHMGINTNIFKPSNCEKNIDILSIGRFVEKKGFEYALEAIKMLDDQGFNIKYEIIGDGIMFDKYKKIASEIKGKSTVIFSGKKERDYIINALNQTKYFIATSVVATDGDEEGIPMTIMEAAGVGLPIISTKHKGIQEIITDKSSGLLVPERDTDSIAQSLKVLISDPNLCNFLGSNARKKILSEFNLDIQNDKMFEIYLSIYNNKFSRN